MGKQNNNGYTTIATKVSLADKAKLLFIGNSFGMSLYELIQALLLALIRYFDKDTMISEEHGKMMEAFANIINTAKDSFNPLAIKNRQYLKVCSAIMFLKKNKCNNTQVISIGDDGNGKITESWNTDRMLSDFLRSCDPQTLKALEKERNDMGYFSIGQTLHEVVRRASNSHADRISEDVKSLFDDIRIPTGQKIDGEIFYKRKLNRGYISQTPEQKKFIHADL